MFSKLRACYSSWSHGTPLPKNISASNKFQKWHHCQNGRWEAVETSDLPDREPKNRAPDGLDILAWIRNLEVVTWNVDAGSPSPESRMTTLLDDISVKTTADIIMLQEVNRAALARILAHPKVQNGFYISDANQTNFGKQSFITVSIMEKRFLLLPYVSLGAIWRVPLPSRFERDALCFDLTFGKLPPSTETRRIRFINAHLDSLPINPSKRPEQVSIIAEYLRVAGHGLLAGDFNPVLPEDAEIVSKNALNDAWTLLKPHDAGFTWGWAGDKEFPPGRFDKVVMHNLTPTEIYTVQPSSIDCGGATIQASDHLGVCCIFNKFD